MQDAHLNHCVQKDLYMIIPSMIAPSRSENIS